MSEEKKDDVKPATVGLKPYRLKKGAEFVRGYKLSESTLDVAHGGEIVHLTEDQARAFADRLEPVQ